MKTGRRQSAFTLIECLIAVTILAGSILAMTTAVTSAQSQMQQLRHAQKAVMLANDLIERINALPYDDPNGITTTGPDGGVINNADDYHGFTEQPGAVKNQAGTLYPSEFQVFGRVVSAQYGTATLGGLGAINCLNVTVTVWDSRATQWKVTACIPEPPG